MERPLADKRPLGPFAQRGSKKGEVFIHFNKSIPQGKRSTVEDIVLSQMRKLGVNVSEAVVGPERTNDTVSVDVEETSVTVDELQTAANGTVKEMRSNRLNGYKVTNVEVIFN